MWALITMAAMPAPALATADLVDADGLLVLGVIASGEATDGVVLVKDQSTGRTFAVRVGQDVARDAKVRRVTREFVYIDWRGETLKIRVGEQVAQNRDSAYISGNADRRTSQYQLPGGKNQGGIERRGNEVHLSESLRDHVVKHDLSKVLMQAAAVPYYAGGRLQGFRLWDIEPGSLYEQAGFINGDIITAINGRPLTDVGLTMQVLQSLKSEPRAEVTLTRQGVEQTLRIVVR